MITSIRRFLRSFYYALLVILGKRVAVEPISDDEIRQLAEVCDDEPGTITEDEDGFVVSGEEDPDYEEPFTKPAKPQAILVTEGSTEPSLLITEDDPKPVSLKTSSGVEFYIDGNKLSSVNGVSWHISRTDAITGKVFFKLPDHDTSYFNDLMQGKQHEIAAMLPSGRLYSLEGVVFMEVHTSTRSYSYNTFILCFTAKVFRP